MGMEVSRVIGKHVGQEKGPLLVVIGGLHGNEPAGVHAIDLIAKMLEVEPITNPDFVYRGTFLGIVGNVQAFLKKKRFIRRDINRMWTPKKVEEVFSVNKSELRDEDLEIREIMDVIHQEIKENNVDKLVVLDLHTTSSYGGIFSIPTDNEESVKIAIELHAPVVKGMLEGIYGTTLHYFNTENMGIDTVAVTFESGQHNEDLSVNRAIAAVTNCMRSIGAVEAEHVENRHDSILIEYSQSLPKVTQLLTRHGITEEDEFKMEEGFNNFQTVKKGETLARDKNGKIIAQDDGLILMPLYQQQGEDGFFLVRKVEGY